MPGAPTTERGSAQQYLSASCVSNALQHSYRSACRLLVSLLAVQAIKQKWLEYKQLDAESDTEPLTDVEYDDQPVESDAGGGETPGGSLAAAGTSSQRHTQEHTPPPAKRQKKQVCVPAAPCSCPEHVRPSSAL